jgi:hypothetical protein
MLMEMPDARPFLAEVCQLKEQAEGMGDLVGLGEGEMIDESPLGSETHRIVVLTRGGGESADLIQVKEYQFPCLLADDRIKAAGQVANLSVKNVAQAGHTLDTCPDKVNQQTSPSS